MHYGSQIILILAPKMCVPNNVKLIHTYTNQHTHIHLNRFLAFTANNNPFDMHTRIYRDLIDACVIKPYRMNAKDRLNLMQ